MLNKKIHIPYILPICNKKIKIHTKFEKKRSHTKIKRTKRCTQNRWRCERLIVLLPLGGKSDIIDEIYIAITVVIRAVTVHYIAAGLQPKIGKYVQVVVVHAAVIVQVGSGTYMVINKC